MESIQLDMKQNATTRGYHLCIGQTQELQKKEKGKTRRDKLPRRNKRHSTRVGRSIAAPATAQPEIKPKYNRKAHWDKKRKEGDGHILSYALQKT